jgi:hypothetical protein
MSDYSNWGSDETFIAAADISAKQFHIVELTSAQTVNAAANATDGGIGVLQNKPEASEAATVRLLGISKVRAGGTVSAGDYFKQSSGGYATVPVSGDALPFQFIGRAITAAASGAYFTAMINPQKASSVSSGTFIG